MAQPVLLVFALKETNRRVVPFAAMRLGIRIRPVGPAEYDLTLDGLLRGPAQPGFDRGEGAFDEEMLLMADFTPALMNRFLQELKRMKAVPIARKAVLTPANRAWSARTLYGELGKEHEAVQNAGRAHA